MDLNLTGRKAIVCGSTQGIGRACAEALAQLGASITLIARDEEKLRAVRDRLSSTGKQKHNYLISDFSYPEGLRVVLRDFIYEEGPAHIVVNNTGGPPAGKAIDAKAEDFRNAFTAHLICNQIIAQAAVEGMKKAGYGRIVNIISTSVKQPIPGLGVSNAIRGAVANWAKTLAAELGPYGITVNNVLPGATNTSRLRSLMESNATRSGKTLKEIEGDLTGEIPARRIAEPHEIASAVAFLASPAAGYINGINLPVDGGRTACL